jgi:hypothetical protein
MLSVVDINILITSLCVVLGLLSCLRHFCLTGWVNVRDIRCHSVYLVLQTQCDRSVHFELLLDLMLLCDYCSVRTRQLARIGSNQDRGVYLFLTMLHTALLDYHDECYCYYGSDWHRDWYDDYLYCVWDFPWRSGVRWTRVNLTDKPDLIVPLVVEHQVCAKKSVTKEPKVAWESIIRTDSNKAVWVSTREGKFHQIPLWFDWKLDISNVNRNGRVASVMLVLALTVSVAVGIKIASLSSNNFFSNDIIFLIGHVNKTGSAVEDYWSHWYWNCDVWHLRTD